MGKCAQNPNVIASWWILDFTFPLSALMASALDSHWSNANFVAPAFLYAIRNCLLSSLYFLCFLLKITYQLPLATLFSPSFTDALSATVVELLAELLSTKFLHKFWDVDPSEW